MALCRCGAAPHRVQDAQCGNAAINRSPHASVNRCRTLRLSGGRIGCDLSFIARSVISAVRDGFMRGECGTVNAFGSD
jgi:hypothetical protein